MTTTDFAVYATADQTTVLVEGGASGSMPGPLAASDNPADATAFYQGSVTLGIDR